MDSSATPHPRHTCVRCWWLARMRVDISQVSRVSFRVNLLLFCRGGAFTLKFNRRSLKRLICVLCFYRFGTKRVKANQVYQEYIQDKHHLHMNSTRWVTLTEFIKHLGRTGVARVDDTEKGWFIAWIDNSPKALAKAVSHIHETS